MAVKEIVQIWDDENIIEDNIHFLRTPTKKVTFPLSPFIKQIIEDLIDTFQAITCAGIAANQIGYPYHIFIGAKDLDESDLASLEEAEVKLSNRTNNIHEENFEIYINPEIIKYSQDSVQEVDEGCLSISGVQVYKLRFQDIKVKYFDIEGKKHIKKLNYFQSKLFQHEIDHLNGILMFDNNLIDADLYDPNPQNVKKIRRLISSYFKLTRPLQ